MFAFTTSTSCYFYKGDIFKLRIVTMKCVSLQSKGLIKRENPVFMNILILFSCKEFPSLK